jgi:hypothetical protein
MKRFRCVWGAGYTPKDAQTVSMSFFNDGNGYDEDTIQQIAAMAVGDTLNLSGVTDEHYVIRMQDAPEEC